MKKVSLYVFLGLVFSNISLAQSLLPECEGNDIKDPVKKFVKIKKLSNCQGTFTGLKGEMYVGEFNKGKFHGQGTFMQAGRKYVGQYKNHKKHGQGTYTYANGDRYTGEWKNGKRHGKGTFIHSSGRIEEGIWKKGKLTKP